MVTIYIVDHSRRLDNHFFGEFPEKLWDRPARCRLKGGAGVAVAGVIAEYNPFHRGHGWLLAELRRRLGADTAVIACMSGNFVQRGDFAILSKYARTEAALLGGADLVLELPTPWSAAAAERFAQGGVAVLAATGVVTHLVFGSESGELAPLQRAADCLESPAYRAGLRRYADSGLPFAAARQAVVQELAGEAADCLSRPNDTLAVEYLRALRAAKEPMEPLALPRVGAGHDSGEASPMPSASLVRKTILTGGDWRPLLPGGTAAILDREIAAGRAPVSMGICQRAVLARLRQMDEADFLPYDGGNEGLYHRFYNAIRTASSLDGVLTAAKTKRYPMARLRRMLLQSYLGAPQAAQGEIPPYLRVLGANARGRALLGQMRGRTALPVLTKPGHARLLDREARRVFHQEAACTDLYTLAYPALDQAAPGQEFRAGPVMQ